MLASTAWVGQIDGTNSEWVQHMARRKSEAAEVRIMESCDMCGAAFQMGPHVYDGKFLSRYQLSVCKPCFEGNWDGWAPHFEQTLKAHLKAKGIPLPRRNAAGHYFRGD